MEIIVRKQDLKDIAHQMISITMQGFDCSFMDSNISSEDEKYVMNIFAKYEKEFNDKIKDEKYKYKASVDEMIDIANGKL